MMRLAILGLAASVLTFAAAAEAAVLRFSVELDKAHLHFDDLSGSDGSFLPVGDPAQEEIAAAIHPLRDIIGATGRSILELRVLSSDEIAGTPSEDYTHALSCLSGFLCGLEGGALFSGYGDYQPVWGAAGLGGFRYRHGVEAHPTGTAWALDFLTGTGRLLTDHDGNISGYGTHNSVSYFWWAPGSEITFTDVRIVPNPLPAPIFLLGAGLIPLALLRRREQTRSKPASKRIAISTTGCSETT